MYLLLCSYHSWWHHHSSVYGFSFIPPHILWVPYFHIGINYRCKTYLFQDVPVLARNQIETLRIYSWLCECVECGWWVVFLLFLLVGGINYQKGILMSLLCEMKPAQLALVGILLTKYARHLISFSYMRRPLLGCCLLVLVYGFVCFWCFWWWWRWEMMMMMEMRCWSMLMRANLDRILANRWWLYCGLVLIAATLCLTSSIALRAFSKL